MKIKLVVVGSLETNCYILEKDGKVLVIDPGADTKCIQEAIGNKQVLKVLVTHQHFDHIGSLYDIMELYKVGKIDFSNMSSKKYSIGPFQFSILKTPGHSNDSITFYFEEENCMFVGDFIFQNTVGRCDLPTGNFQIMKESIEMLKKYPDDIILYPGHGPSTMLGIEKKNNPYF